MNYLQLCNEVKTDAAIPGPALTTLTGLSDILERIPSWVNRAIRDIERHRVDWPWKRVTVTFNTSPDKRNYPAVELNLSDVRKWDTRRCRIYLDSVGNESLLTGITFPQWEESFSFGTQNTSRPTYIYQDGSTTDLCFYPIPDDEYTVTASYYQSPVDLVATTDIPTIPEEFHDVIVARATMLYALEDDAPEIFSVAKATYQKLLGQMEEDLEPTYLSHEPVA